MITGAVLYAKSLPTLREFYLTLGGTVTDEDAGDYVLITAQGALLVILQTPSHIAAQIGITTPPRVRADTPLKPIIQIASMHDALDAAHAKGGALLAGADQWEFRKHLVRDIFDPEGNVIQLWQPICKS